MRRLPRLGGAIVENFSWPLSFCINIPIGILAFAMTLPFVRDPDYITKPERGADWIGLAAMNPGLASLQYVLERGPHDDWFASPSILILTLVAELGMHFGPGTLQGFALGFLFVPLTTGIARRHLA